MMTIEQFNALAKLLRMGKKPRQAAQMVLVDGATQSAAAQETGMSMPGISNMLKRCRNGLELAKVAAGNL